MKIKILFGIIAAILIVCSSVVFATTYVSYNGKLYTYDPTAKTLTPVSDQNPIIKAGDYLIAYDNAYIHYNDDTLYSSINDPSSARLTFLDIAEIPPPLTVVYNQEFNKDVLVGTSIKTTNTAGIITLEAPVGTVAVAQTGVPVATGSVSPPSITSGDLEIVVNQPLFVPSQGVPLDIVKKLKTRGFKTETLAGGNIKATDSQGNIITLDKDGVVKSIVPVVTPSVSAPVTASSPVMPSSVADAAKGGLSGFVKDDGTTAVTKDNVKANEKIYKVETLSNGLTIMTEYKSTEDRTATGRITVIQDQTKFETSADFLPMFRDVSKENIQALPGGGFQIATSAGITTIKKDGPRDSAETIARDKDGKIISHTIQTIDPSIISNGRPTTLLSTVEYTLAADGKTQVRGNTRTVVSGSNEPHSLVTAEGYGISYLDDKGKTLASPVVTHVEGISLKELPALISQATAAIATANKQLEDATTANNQNNIKAAQEALKQAQEKDAAIKKIQAKASDKDKIKKAEDEHNTEHSQWTSRSIFGGINYALTEFQGLKGYSSLIFSKEFLSSWRESVDEAFASAYLGSKYWVSAICSHQYDKQVEGVAFVKTPDTLAHAAAHVEGRLSTVTENPITHEKTNLYQITAQVKPINSTPEFSILLSGPDTVNLLKTYFNANSMTATPTNYSTYAGANSLVYNTTKTYNKVCIHFIQLGEFDGDLCNTIR